jgi:hypothetical protein
MRRRRLPPRRPEPPDGMMWHPDGKRVVPIGQVSAEARYLFTNQSNALWRQDPSYHWAERVRRRREKES